MLRCHDLHVLFFLVTVFLFHLTRDLQVSVGFGPGFVFLDSGCSACPLGLFASRLLSRFPLTARAPYPPHLPVSLFTFLFGVNKSLPCIKPCLPLYFLFTCTSVLAVWR